jgi:amicyanin
MKNKFLIVGIMTLAVVAAVGVIISQSMKPKDEHSAMPMTSTQDTPADTGMQQSANEVIIKNYAFGPSPITVKKGTTVTWTNKDIAKHNVEMDEGQPAGDPVESALFGKDETYSFTFNTVGKFNYHCSPHPYMKGTVEVTES